MLVVLRLCAFDSFPFHSGIIGCFEIIVNTLFITHITMSMPHSPHLLHVLHTVGAGLSGLPMVTFFLNWGFAAFLITASGLRWLLCIGTWWWVAVLVCWNFGGASGLKLGSFPGTCIAIPGSVGAGFGMF